LHADIFSSAHELLEDEENKNNKNNSHQGLIDTQELLNDMLDTNVQIKKEDLKLETAYLHQILEKSTILVDSAMMETQQDSQPLFLDSTENSDTSVHKSDQNSDHKEEKRKNGKNGTHLKDAQTVFTTIIQAFTRDVDLIDFITFVDQTLSKDYGVSLFNKYKKKVNQQNDIDTKPKQAKGKTTHAKKSKKTKQQEADVSFGSDSLLAHVNMRDIVNLRTFNLLTANEKDSLLPHLPDVDCENLSSIEDTFTSNAFMANLPLFQEMLEAGEFENSTEDHSHLKAKKKRQLDPWKEKYFEEYWGQKYQEKEDQNQILHRFSFVEFEKQNPQLAALKSETLDDVVWQDEEFTIDSDGDYAAPYKSSNTKKATKRKVEKEEDDSAENTPTEGKIALSQRRKKYREAAREKEKQNEFINMSDGSDGEGKDAISKLFKQEKASSGTSFKHTAYQILKREGKPLSAAQIVKVALKEGLINTSGKTPQNTLASVIYCEIKKDPQCVFVKVAPMTFGLREWKNIKEVASDSEVLNE